MLWLTFCMLWEAVCSNFRSHGSDGCLELVPFIIEDREEVAALSIVIHEPRPGPVRCSKGFDGLGMKLGFLRFSDISLGHIYKLQMNPMTSYSLHHMIRYISWGNGW